MEEDGSHMDDDDEELILSTECLCWSARSCVILWNLIGFVLSTSVFITAIVTGIYHFGRPLDDMLIVTGIIDPIISIFMLFAAILQNKRMLVITFWFVIFNMIYLVIIMIMICVYIFGIAGEMLFYNNLEKWEVFTFAAVFVSIIMMLQILLGLLVRLALNEARIKQRNELKDTVTRL